MGHEPDETAYADPAQSDRFAAVKAFFPPAAGGSEFRSTRVMRINQQIDVGNDHRRRV